MKHIPQHAFAGTEATRSFLDYFHPGLDDLLIARDALLAQNNPSALAIANAAYGAAKKSAISKALSTGATLAAITAGLYFLSKKSR